MTTLINDKDNQNDNKNKSDYDNKNDNKNENDNKNDNKKGNNSETKNDAYYADVIISNNAVIKVKDLSTSYEKDGKVLKVLASINFEVNENEFVTIVGPSGCGKSTLLKVLAGLERVDSGEVFVKENENGVWQEILKNNARVPVCYMLQKDLLMPWRTMLDNILLPLEARGESFNIKSVRESIKPMIREFGLEGFENFMPSELSGGMKQRAALLRTYLMKGNIMLLDEPFGALDAFTRMNMQEWLLRIWEKHRKTVVFVTHDIDEAVLLSDRVYVISGNPGHISAEIAIKFNRPRNHDMLVSEEFLKYKKSILKGFVNKGEG